MVMRCPICNEFLYEHFKHKCDPVWECIEKESFEDGDDWTKVWAMSAEVAAELFSENWDSYNCEYPDSKDVIVKDTAGELHHFEVTLETCPEYTATKKEMEVKVEP